MAVSFTWKIERLECRLLVGERENVVGKVHWRVFGSEGDVQESIYGMTEIAFDESAAFVAFEALTEETVISWVQDRLGASAIDAHKASLAAAVTARLDPPVVVLSPPWIAATSS